jgi:hypothetical protein
MNNERRRPLQIISVVQSLSSPSHSIFNVPLPPFERTIALYFDVVASGNTILKVANIDLTIIAYYNASAVCIVVLVPFSKIIIMNISCFKDSTARSHCEPILGIVP